MEKSRLPQRSAQKSLTKPISYLVNAIASVGSLLEQVDEEHTPAAIIRSTFKAFGKDLAAATDWAINVITGVTGGNLSINADTGGAYSIARDNEKYWYDQKKILEDFVATTKSELKAAFQAANLDGCAGSVGGFKLAGEDGSLKTVFKTDKFSKTNVIKPEEVTFFSIPARYLTLTTIVTLNADELKKDIMSGSYECSWATVEKSPRLTIDKKQVKLCQTNS